MAEIKEIKQISVNGTLYSIGGGNDSPFIKADNGGAYMSGCTASGQNAVAEGNGTNASGNYSHAEGYDTIASGYFSHAEGRGTLASDYFSHAEGGFTTASTYASHAEGDNTKAIGHSSHAEGNNTIASGIYSHAEGRGTSATTQSEHASGQYNVSLSGSSDSSDFGHSGSTLFTVGNGILSGTTSNNKIYTHNALQIMQNGDIYIPDTSSEGEFYEKPMIKLQDALKNTGSGGDVDLQELINRISELETKVATLITKAEVEKGFNNVITVVDDTTLKIRNNALEDEGTE